PVACSRQTSRPPALIAGTGLGILPEFILREALAAHQLERLLPDWSLPSGGVYWVTPPGGPRPKRVEVLADFLIDKLSRCCSSETFPVVPLPDSCTAAKPD